MANSLQGRPLRLKQRAEEEAMPGQFKGTNVTGGVEAREAQAGGLEPGR